MVQVSHTSTVRDDYAQVEVRTQEMGGSTLALKPIGKVIPKVRKKGYHENDLGPAKTNYRDILGFPKFFW